MTYWLTAEDHDVLDEIIGNSSSYTYIRRSPSGNEYWINICSTETAYYKLMIRELPYDFMRRVIHALCLPSKVMR